MSRMSDEEQAPPATMNEWIRQQAIPGTAARRARELAKRFGLAPDDDTDQPDDAA